MYHKRKVISIASLAIATLLAFSWNSLFQRPRQFSTALEWDGKTIDNYSAFTFSLTNKSLVGNSPGRIRFQWIDKAGRTDSCHADLAQHKGVLTAYIGIPADAKKVRVLLCGTPTPARIKIQSLLKNLPERLWSLVPDNWLNPNDVHSPVSAWTVNPALQPTPH